MQSSPGDAGRHRPEVAVERGRRGVRRSAGRSAAPPAPAGSASPRLAAPGGHGDRRLGRAVAVEEGRRRAGGAEARRQLGRQRLAAASPRSAAPQARASAASLDEDGEEPRAGRSAWVTRSSSIARAQVGRVAAGRRGGRGPSRPPARSGPKSSSTETSKAIGVFWRTRTSRPSAVEVGRRVAQEPVDDRAVADDDPLRPAGRARGVDDVGRGGRAGRRRPPARRRRPARRPPRSAAPRRTTGTPRPATSGAASAASEAGAAGATTAAGAASSSIAAPGARPGRPGRAAGRRRRPRGCRGAPTTSSGERSAAIADPRLRARRRARAAGGRAAPARPVELAVGEAPSPVERTAAASGPRAALRRRPARARRRAGAGSRRAVSFHSASSWWRSAAARSGSAGEPAARASAAAAGEERRAGGRAGAPTVVAVEEVGAVARARRRARPPSSTPARAMRSNFAVACSQLDRRERRGRASSSGAARRVLEREHDLEERRAAEVALRLQLLDQPLERQVLVGVGAERRRARTRPRSSREAGVAGEVGAQRRGC